MVISATPTNAKVLVIPQRQDYVQPPVAKTVPLDKIRKKLDMTLLALKVLIGINSESIVRVASKLNIPPKIVDKIALTVGEDKGEKWAVSENQPLKVQEAQSFILVICHLAKQNQALIRRAVALMEQMGTEDSKLQSVTLLREYICNFKKAHQDYYWNREKMKPDNSETLALKLLVDLLFYSAPQGCDRLLSSLKS
ncbi:MAG: DUF3038 domain-containing protein [Okeania sp. SIO3I5]|uniref:DUF3038 domain-containing protein n=1 Tax=Okeania sp. SIO3I5 TaxID=2607805 RepID=UPI0013BCAF64|nr:DUF3038 domain-containing protein [Okeania sp. SIO3I5]NEQ38927.1 DUF3038 domain-containing protein [Okeania sp. SIO3I5]